MTRNDYKAAAALIAESPTLKSQEKEVVINTFIAFFQESNPRFDPSIFRKRCL